MLQFARKNVRKALKYLVVGPSLDARLSTIEAHFASTHQQIQKQLLATLRRQFLDDPSNYAKNLGDFGFRAYSQYEEDGLLLYIFAAIGFESKRVVEMSAGNGQECMATNLIINHQFDGLLFDGDPALVEAGKKFFASHKDTHLCPPSFHHAWITTKNVNELLASNHFTGEVDLLSLDLDGIDYWIWNAIDVIQPRVCVFETNNSIPADLSLTVPYCENFDSSWNKPLPEQYFRGVSLKAMAGLSSRKGYRLIGANRLGFNVLFMRDDVGRDAFPEIELVKVHDNPSTRKVQEVWPSLERFPWQAA